MSSDSVSESCGSMTSSTSVGHRRLKNLASAESLVTMSLNQRSGSLAMLIIRADGHVRQAVSRLYWICCPEPVGQWSGELMEVSVRIRSETLRVYRQCFLGHSVDAGCVCDVDAISSCGCCCMLFLNSFVHLFRRHFVDELFFSLSRCCYVVAADFQVVKRQSDK